jgi:hypothetical protein
MPELFQVCRIKRCPVRGVRYVIESVPLPPDDAYRAKLALESLSPGETFFLDHTTDTY